MPYDFRTIKYIPGLDGIRAVAVLLVMAAHFGFKNTVPGGFGVTVFFFLSGFLITTLLIQEHRHSGVVSIKNFYIRRALRLMPELIALLAFSAIYRYLLGAGPSGAEILAALSYTTNYYLLYVEGYEKISFSWPHLWSLSVEEHYYITFPLLFSAIMRNGRLRLAFFAGSLALCLLYRCILIYSDLTATNTAHPYTYIASEARYDSIVFGAAFAFLAQSYNRFTVWQGGGLLSVGCAVILATLVIRDPEFRETVRYSLQGLGLFCIFCGIYLSDRPIYLVRLLELPIVKAMGVLSYGAYLWHLEYLFWADKLFSAVRDGSVPHRLIFAGVGIAVSFMVAYVSHRLIAQPFAKLRSRFQSHVNKPLQPTSGAVAAHAPSP